MYKRQVEGKVTAYTEKKNVTVDGKFTSTDRTKTVTLAKGSSSVSDEGEGHKFVLENGKVYRVVVNGVASNEVKGK